MGHKRCTSETIQTVLSKLYNAVRDRVYLTSSETNRPQVQRDRWNEATDEAKDLINKYY